MEIKVIWECEEKVIHCWWNIQGVIFREKYLRKEQL